MVLPEDLADFRQYVGANDGPGPLDSTASSPSHVSISSFCTFRLRPFDHAGQEMVRLICDQATVYYGLPPSLTQRHTDVQNKELDSLFEFDYNPFLLVDKNGRIVSWNRKMSEITGKNSREVLFKPFDTVLPAQEREEFMRKLSAFKRGVDLPFLPLEVPFTHKTSQTAFVNMLFRLEPNGRLFGLGVETFDEELHRANTILSELLAGDVKMCFLGIDSAGIVRIWNKELAILSGRY